MKSIAYKSENFPAAETAKKNYLASRVFLLGFIDFLLLNIAFWGTHWIKYQSFSLSSSHKDLLITIVILWFIILLYSKKISLVQNHSFWSVLKIITKSNFILVMLLSLVIIVLDMKAVSRIQGYGTCILFYGMEIIGYLIIYKFNKSHLPLEAVKKSIKVARHPSSYFLLMIDGALCFLSFLMVVLYLNRDTFFIRVRNIDYILTLCFLWIIASILTNKFNKNNLRNLNVWLSANIKSILIMTGCAAILVFGMRISDKTRALVFASILTYFIVESLFFYLCFLYFKYGGNVRDIEDVFEIGKMIETQKTIYEKEGVLAETEVNDPVAIKLMNALEFLNPKLFEFINENIDLSSIDRTESVLLSTENIFNVNSLDQRRVRLFVNLHKINDMRWFNQYFLSVHTKLVAGGYLVGHAHTIETQKVYFFEKYPRFIAIFVYVLHFIWTRVMPKLPWTQKVYFALTKGRNRIVSMAEVFGRLYFCGFKIIADQIINDRLYFIAQKIKAPSIDKNPTYGPIIRLKRFCSEDHSITVYKFRTMYPYSEYLQEYVYQKNHLKEGGKFKNDFRVTGWGTFLRKTWLDEFPNLYNWLKGDLQLIGVRPLSYHYLSLYDPQVRLLRDKVKPGLIPAPYADLPKTLEELQKSEIRYIESYLQRPFLTQIKYLYKSVINILITKNYQD